MRFCWNQEIGSPQTVDPLMRFKPSGTPTIGVPAPTTYGHSPQT